MADRLVTYIAHPLSGDFEANRQRAMRWFAWAAKVQGVSPVADWILMSSLFEETPENRAMGLECDVALVKRCLQVWLVGGRISSGMHMEAGAAHSVHTFVYDLTHLGEESPDGPIVIPESWRWMP